MSTMVIPIVMAADNNYAYPMFVSLASLCLSANKNTIYNVHLLLDKYFSETNFERLAILQNSFNRHKVEVHVMDEKYDDIKINIDHIKTATFYRLELPKLLPDVNQCIYLDVDTIVNKDLSELFRLNIDDKYIAGVRAAAYYYPEKNARGYSNKLGIDNIFSYVNAGVLLMNLKTMRKDGLMDIFTELIKKDFPSMDQDILNSACYGKIRILHPKYNAMTKYSLKDDGAYQSMKCLQLAYTLEEWDTARKQPVIIHYADKIKPWNDLSVDYAEKWWRVATEIPFFKEIYQHYYEQIIYAATVKKQINTLHKQYEKYSTLRMDIRNRGNKECDVIEKGIVPQPLSVRKPQWLPDGITVESISECMSVAIQCKGDGELEIGLMGRYVLNEDEKRYPVWIDCTYFAVNGEAVFSETKTVCYDKRYVYRKPVTDGEIVKLDVTWSECRSSNVLDEYRKLQAELKNSKNKTNQLQTELKKERNEVITVQKQINTLHKQYDKYSTLRMDIRNRGNEGCDVLEQGIVPQPLSVRRPQWLPDGITVESIAERMSVAVQCKGDGELEICLLGRDVRNEDGKRYPVWIDCTFFAVNGEVIFSEPKTVCHDKRYVYKKPVVDGEIVKLDVTWSECRSSNVLDEYRQLQAELKNSKNKTNQLQAELRSSNNKTNQLQMANAKTLKELNETQRKVAILDKELQNVKNGWSFKIGRMITYIPRVIFKNH